MNIRKWASDRILQLPDSCFGRQWPLSIGMEQTSIGTYFDISEAALPEACVIWKFYMWTPVYALGQVLNSFALGDILPTTDAEFDALEPLFRDIGIIVAGRRTIRTFRSPSPLELSLRMPLAAMGRRLVGRFEWIAESFSNVYVNLVVSSIPTEIPEFLTDEFWQLCQETWQRR